MIKIFNLQIKNIDDIKININTSMLIIFSIILTATIFGFHIIHNRFIQNKSLIANQEINTAQDLYKSNLSEKLSIIASSTLFLDYIRSGSESRALLHARFLNQISQLKTSSISGMKIINSSGDLVFKSGKSTENSVSLQLCYLNQSLNNIMGDCDFTWQLFFNKYDLLKDIQKINTDIQLCANCRSPDFFESPIFGSFLVKSHSNLGFNLGIIETKDNFFNIYLFLMGVALSLFAFWSWHRLNSTVNKYISNPLKKLTANLKSDSNINTSNNIEEIQYLIDEINSWKFKLNKSQSDKNAAKLAEIAAQLAHDVRSPLSAIDMLIKNLGNIPDNYRISLESATQRISDIANTFLSQYNDPKDIYEVSTQSNEFIPGILENIISEKRNQYLERNVDIKLTVDANALLSFALVNVSDFKRVLSNLINNSIEAISDSIKGSVNINLTRDNDHLHIKIIDNGCGISKELIPIILSGTSIGKKNGSGLGLSHAVKIINSWGGYLNIQSESSLGTQITLTLNSSKQPPEWIKLKINIQPKTIICVLDDEPVIHKLWQKKLNNFMQNITTIEHLQTSDEITNFLSNNNKINITYFIDYDLAGSKETGLDIIKRFGLHKDSTLVTSRYDDFNIQQQCIALGVKIIPKNLLSSLSIMLSSE